MLDVYTLNGQNYTQTGTYTQLLTNSYGCDSTITLNLVVNHTGFDDNQNSLISIFPNPASDIVFLLGLEDLDGNINIKLFDFKGSLIKKIKEKESIDISFLSKGLYYFEIEYEKQRHIHRFIKK